MTTDHVVRLTPEQFKAVVIGKGWTYRELASRWGVTPVWVSNIARNAERPSHYDDAVLGLPVRRNLRRNEKRRMALVDAFVQKIAGAPRKATGAYRYHGHLVVGTIVAAAEDVGSIAESGMRGIVFQVRDLKHGEDYGVIFETGLWDWFSADYVDRYLVATGLVDEGATHYKFVSEEVLQNDAAAGRFCFWAA